MKDDPIVAEVRAIRDAHAARFNYDLKAIFADIKLSEATSGRTYVSFPPKRISPVTKRARADSGTLSHK